MTRFVSSWSDEAAVQVTSMVLTDGVLFAAGPPDVEDEERSAVMLSDPATEERLAEQSAAFEGRLGGRLVAISPEDGRFLAGYQLDEAPCFDGLIAAAGRLYLTSLDGKVICLDPQAGKPLRAASEEMVTPRTDDSEAEAAEDEGAADEEPVAKPRRKAKSP